MNAQEWADAHVTAPISYRSCVATETFYRHYIRFENGETYEFYEDDNQTITKINGREVK